MTTTKSQGCRLRDDGDIKLRPTGGRNDSPATAPGPSSTPRHVGVILDGNRRWARENGVSEGEAYRRGAAKAAEFLGWCEDAGVEVATLWVLSIDNLQRSADVLQPLIDATVAGLWNMAATGRWRLRPVGNLSLLPARVTTALREMELATAANAGIAANIAIAYDGREDIAEAVRDLLRQSTFEQRTGREISDRLTAGQISEHLVTGGQPEVDLIFRTSGELRTSGFLLWQSARAELYFSPVFWPAFSRIDFDAMLAAFARRDRRLGV